MLEDEDLAGDADGLLAVGEGSAGAADDLTPAADVAVLVEV